MRRFALALACGLPTLAIALPALADPASLPPLPPGPPPAASVAPAPPPAAAPASSRSGVAVVAMPGATDAAWPLAQAVYATPALRPFTLDETHARVLCGEKPADGAAADLVDLSDSVAGIRGEDAASRAILADLARRLNVRALVVVHASDGRPLARVFVTDVAAFDAASYGPDDRGWQPVTQSLARAFGTPADPSQPTLTPAPPLATHPEPVLVNEPPKKKAFYESGWFWGALGAAAFAGGAVFFATRDNGASTIHLDMQVPH